MAPEKERQNKNNLSRHHQFLGGGVGVGGAPASPFVPGLGRDCSRVVGQRAMWVRVIRAASC